MVTFLTISLAFVLAEPVVEVRSRSFQFDYEATVTGLLPDDHTRIWLPVPTNSPDQNVEILEFELPGAATMGRESRFGNRILSFDSRPNARGEIPLRISYLITRKEARAASGKTSTNDAQLFLKPDSKVPSDGKYLSLIAGKKLPSEPMEFCRSMYDLVNSELHYSKAGTGWGQGDANWVCESKYGNCTDFHSLFIGLVRSAKIPGKFEIGFPLPEKRGKGEIAGYHCWAKFQIDGKGWVPVDISMANQNSKLKDYCFGNLTEDRVAFSVGRDLVLTPKQGGPPLNFFIYPYVEVGGKPLPNDKIKRKFNYRDIVEK
jgi:transglutaminase-like putative cysteine protease